MADIPENVMETARRAIMAEVSPHARWQYADGRCDHSAVVQAVAKAIVAERARCAGIARGVWLAAGSPGDEDGGRSGAANDIAEQIEAGQ